MHLNYTANSQSTSVTLIAARLTAVYFEPLMMRFQRLCFRLLIREELLEFILDGFWEFGDLSPLQYLLQN